MVVGDRSGKVVRRFTVDMNCRWAGNDGVLEEDFHYSDGKTDRRVWRLKKLANGHYTGMMATSTSIMQIDKDHFAMA